MSWGTLAQSVKVVDVSSWQGEIDWPTFKQLNPDVKQVIIRIAGGWNADEMFVSNYTNALDAGYRPGIYLNNNPDKSARWMMEEWWRPLMRGLPDPPLVVLDAETNGWRDKDGKWHGRYPRGEVTDQLKEIYNMMADEWPDAHRWIYSGHWWGENVVVRQPWMSDLKFWTPHYIYYVFDKALNQWRVAYSYEEHDPHIPETSAAIPRLPVGIKPEQIVAWQITDKGIVPPISKGTNKTPRVDLNYVTLEEYNLVWGEQAPPVIPPVVIPEPCKPIQRVVVTANVLNIRNTPSTANKPLGALLRGAEVPIYELSGDWGMIADGVWVHTGYTRKI